MNENHPLNGGGKHNDFPLVRRPSSAVEKAAPGAKRILSGMVADTLVLVKKARPPRIVLVDDENWLREFLELVIHSCIKDAVVLSFDNGDQAWQELLSTDPDLLITDINRPGLNGLKMLSLLAARKVKFPILVASGFANKKELLQYAGPDLNFSFLRKPFTIAAFHCELLGHLAGKVVDVLALFSSGDDTAQFYLGVCYQNGFGVSQDDTEAVKWYRKAAEQNNILAQHSLGGCYFIGKGVAWDCKEAVKWFRKAADQDSAPAQCSLGVCYGFGKGVAQDFTESAKWHRKAAEKGYALAEFNLGYCYEHGQGVPQDFEEAVKWYRKAAGQHHLTAQENLGACYANGKAVIEDAVDAYQWVKIAEQKSREGAAKTLEVIRLMLSPEQLRKAETHYEITVYLNG
jgi:TPR repeat protein